MTPGASGGRRLEIDWFVPAGSRAQRVLLGALAAARATGKRPYRAPEFEPASAGSG